MDKTDQPVVSIVMATHNRRDVVLHTVSRLMDLVRAGDGCSPDDRPLRSRTSTDSLPDGRSSDGENTACAGSGSAGDSCSSTRLALAARTDRSLAFPALIGASRRLKPAAQDVAQNTARQEPRPPGRSSDESTFCPLPYGRGSDEVDADQAMQSEKKGGGLGWALERGDVEVIVVDNASSDGAAEVVGPLVDRLIRLDRNAGSCAKAYGVDIARGRYIVFLDDDSYPMAGSLERMIEHFERDAKLGAAGFRVHLPDGREECGALPDVFVGCGVGFRAEALRAVGGLDRTFFMQAEEYDLSFRLAGGGWGVRVFDDLHVEHLKSPHARRSERTAYYDIRNNLRVMARYVPAPWRKVYTEDCVLRYGWLAERDGHESAHDRGRRAGRWLSLMDRFRFRSRRLSDEVFERFFRHEEMRGRCVELARAGVRRVVLAGWGKNVFAFYRGCSEAGLSIVAIADDRFGQRDGRRYRGVRVVPVEEALALDYDAVVVSNMAYVFGRETAARWRPLTDAPVYSWFERPVVGAVRGIGSTTPVKTSDDRAEGVVV